mgnify:CR=1 FL=1
MDKLKKFFEARLRFDDDRVSLGGLGTVLEFTRPQSGLYVRVHKRTEGRYDLIVIRGGGSSPKSRFYELDNPELCKRSDGSEYPGLNRSQIRSRFEKAVK